MPPPTPTAKYVLEGGIRMREGKIIAKLATRAHISIKRGEYTHPGARNVPRDFLRGKRMSGAQTQDRKIAHLAPRKRRSVPEKSDNPQKNVANDS